MASPSPQPQTLNYERQPPKKRRWLLPFCIVTVILSLAASVWFGAAPLYRRFLDYRYRAERAEWYSAVASHLDPPGELRWDIGWLSGSNTGGDAKIQRMPVIQMNGYRGFVPNAALFVHERTNSAGETRLLIVGPTNRAGSRLGFETFEFDRHAYDPTRDDPGMTNEEIPNWVDLKGFPLGPLKLFAATLDQADSASFLIPFDASGRRGTIRGTFTNDHYIRWTCEAGSPTTASTGQTRQ